MGVACWNLAVSWPLLELLATPLPVPSKVTFFTSCLSQQEAGAPSQEVALLLHRKGFECSSAPEPPPQCTWSVHEEVREAQMRFWL